MKISIIVVIGNNREIGCNNQLLWDIPKDMARFKRITTDHAVIMGDRTFESIGKALPKRTNIVISLNKDYQAPGCIVAHSIKEAVAKAKAASKKEEIFIIGGGTIYKLFLPITDKLYLTVVDDNPKADTFFPEYNDFKNQIFSEAHEDKGLKFTFLELTR